MSFDSFPTDPNIMNESDLQQLKENYANMIIDGMDMDSLCQMAFDLLLDAYKDCSEDDIKKKIKPFLSPLCSHKLPKDFSYKNTSLCTPQLCPAIFLLPFPVFAGEVQLPALQVSSLQALRHRFCRSSGGLE